MHNSALATSKHSALCIAKPLVQRGTVLTSHIHCLERDYMGLWCNRKLVDYLSIFQREYKVPRAVLELKISHAPSGYWQDTGLIVRGVLICWLNKQEAFGLNHLSFHSTVYNAVEIIWIKSGTYIQGRVIQPPHSFSKHEGRKIPTTKQCSIWLAAWHTEMKNGIERSTIFTVWV